MPLYDDFERANGPVGNGWTVEPGGTVVIVSGRARAGDDTGVAGYLDAPPAQLANDLWVEVQCQPLGTAVGFVYDGVAISIPPYGILQLLSYGGGYASLDAGGTGITPAWTSPAVPFTMGLLHEHLSATQERYTAYADGVLLGSVTHTTVGGETAWPLSIIGFSYITGKFSEFNWAWIDQSNTPTAPVIPPPPPPPDPPPPLPVGTDLSIGVYGRNNSGPVELSRWRNASFRRALKEVGTGQFTLQNDDPDLAGIAIGNAIVKFRLGGGVVHAIVAEQADAEEVAPGEEAEEATVVSGRGTLALTEESVVYPSESGGVEVEPFSDTRRFDWTSRSFSDSGWDTAHLVKLQGNKTTPPYLNAPKDWPDSTAYWVWGVPYAVPQPLGFCLFRKFFTVPVEKAIRIFVTADDGFEVLLDGVPIIAEQKAFLWGETRYEDVFISADEHLLAVKVTNIDRPANPTTNIAAFILSVFELTNGGQNLGALIVNTDDTWKTLAYPTVPIGFTAGHLIKRLLTEAHAHGCIPMVTTDCDEIKDSAGAFWPNAPEFSFQVGSTFLSVINALVEGGWCEVEMDPNTPILHAYVTKGTASGVTLAQGVNLTEFGRSVGA